MVEEKRITIVGKLRTENGETVELKQIQCTREAGNSANDAAIKDLVNFKGINYDTDSFYVSRGDKYYKSYPVSEYRKSSITDVLSAAVKYSNLKMD